MSPAGSKGWCLSLGFRALAFLHSEKMANCICVIAPSSSSALGSELGNQVHLALSKNVTALSEECSGLKYVWITQGFKKRILPILPSLPFLGSRFSL